MGAWARGRVGAWARGRVGAWARGHIGVLGGLTAYEILRVAHARPATIVEVARGSGTATSGHGKREAVARVVARPCGRPRHGAEAREHHLQQLRREGSRSIEDEGAPQVGGSVPIAKPEDVVVLAVEVLDGRGRPRGDNDGE